MLSPDYYLKSVHDIDFAELREAGVQALLVDLDNTLLPRDSNVVPESLREWSRELAASGFKVCLVSNNWHERVSEVASELGFELVAKAVKPLPFAFLRALSKVGARRETAAVVGDQLFTDVLGGKLLGMKTILVAPLSAYDLPHTLLLRRLERMVLAGRTPLP
jgi:uncharacterized protein